MEHNAVKSPEHYTAGRKYEPKDVIRDWGLNFNLGSALKYIARAGRKGDPVEDLSFEVEALKAESKKVKVPVNEAAKRDYRCGVLELEVPEGTPIEDVIQMAITKIMGVNEE